MTRPSIRIAAHCGGGTFGGTETWTARLMSGLGDRGHEPRIYCRDPVMAERFQAYGVVTEIGRLGGVAMIPDAVRLARKLRAFGPDVLLCLTFRKMWLAGLAGRMARVPRILFRVANQGTYPRDALYRFSFKHFVDEVLCNADALRGPFLAAATGFDPGQVVTVYDGVEPGDRTPGVPLRTRMGLDDVPVVGAVGRLVGQKRYDRLLETMVQVPGVHCLIAGDGPDRGPLEDRIDRLDLRDRVHLLGHRSDVPDILSALDVFVIPSDFEGMSNAMLEAMALGVPVVSTPVSGAQEALVPDGVAPAGRVVPPEPAALAAAIAELIGAPGLRAEVGSAARRRYEAAFTFGAMLDVWEAVLGGDPVAGHHQGPSPLVP